MNNKRLIEIVYCVDLVIIGIITIWFVFTTMDLYKFKSCYDINFQNNKCQKYLNY